MNAYIDYIDAHRRPVRGRADLWVLQVAPSTYYAAKWRPPSPRSMRDDRVKAAIVAVFESNYRYCYGARKIWRQLRREGIIVARCTVERLMRQLGLTGLVRGKAKRTTVIRALPAVSATTDWAIPSAARVYNCPLGGFHNFAADREFAEELEQIMPGAKLRQRDQGFVSRAVRWLAGRCSRAGSTPCRGFRSREGAPRTARASHAWCGYLMRTFDAV